MVHDYVESFYLPGARRARWLAADGGARARDLASTLERLRAAWPAIRVSVEDVTVAPGGCDAGRDRRRPRFPQAF